MEHSWRLEFGYSKGFSGPTEEVAFSFGASPGVQLFPRSTERYDCAMPAHRISDSRCGLLGAGRQALETIEYCGEVGLRCEFLVEELPPEYARSEVEYGAPIFTFDDIPSAVVDLPVMVAVGVPKVKRRLVDRWPKETFLTVVSPRAWCASDVTLGSGSTIAPLSSLNRLVVLGSHVLVNAGAILSHDVVVGDFSTIGPNCAVGGKTVIGDDVFLGIGSTIIDGITIGSGAFVAAGSVVVADVDENERVAGVPARPMRAK